GGEFALALWIHPRPTDFDLEILSFDPAKVAQTCTQDLQVDPVARCRLAKRGKQSNPEDFPRLLRTKCDRIEQAYADGEGDKCPPVHH
ncbi:MAG: hypothetical protein ABW071_09405, partial [Casimicrobiaceae bacterium]